MSTALLFEFRYRQKRRNQSGTPNDGSYIGFDARLHQAFTGCPGKTPFSEAYDDVICALFQQSLNAQIDGVLILCGKLCGL